MLFINPKSLEIQDAQSVDHGACSGSGFEMVTRQLSDQAIRTKIPQGMSGGVIMGSITPSLYISFD